MSSYSLLEQTLREILPLINPSREDWSVRFHIIEEIRAAVQSVESLKGATVEPYGSFVSNLFTRWGDLDISIEILTGSYISNAGKKQKQNWLADVQRALRRTGTWRKLQFIAHARVPILKLESTLQNISCDISINNLHGQMKSKLLFWINEIDRRFRDMVLLVKEWAKAHDINDSKNGSLNSYSLSLLIIFHFQTCVPAILPPLREIYPGNMIHDLTGVRTVAEKQIEEICAVNINRFRSDRSRQTNLSSLSDLFISFLAKFCDISLRASVQGISLYNGQWEDIESNTTWLPRTFALFVEDPFEQPVNTARSVSTKQLTRIAEAFRTTHHTLISANQSSYLFAMLIRRERLLSVPGAPIRNPNNYGNHQPRTRPQENYRAMHSPSQVQQRRQFHNPRVDRRPNNVSTYVPNHSPNNGVPYRPVLPNHPGQQVWRTRSQ